MRIHRVFDDLGEFVAAFRGGISRDAILIDLDERHVPGTVLDIDLALADGLSLVRGRAAVADVRQAPSHAVASWRTVLRFASLDPDSRDFLARLERRQEAEGEPVFRPDFGPAVAVPEPPADVTADLTDTGALEVAFRDMSRRPTVRERAAPVEERGRRDGDRPAPRRAVRAAGWVVAVAAVATIGWFAIRAVRHGPHDGGSTAAPTAATTPSPTAAARPTRTAADLPPPPTVAASESAPAAEATSAPTDANGVRVTGLEWTSEGGATVVRVTADRALAPSTVSHFRMDGDPGPRTIVVLRDVDASDLPVRRAVGGAHVAGIRTWLHDDRSPTELHVVLDLAGPDVAADPPRVDGRTVTVRLR